MWTGFNDRKPPWLRIPIEVPLQRSPSPATARWTWALKRYQIGSSFCVRKSATHRNCTVLHLQSSGCLVANVNTYVFGIHSWNYRSTSLSRFQTLVNPFNQSVFFPIFYTSKSMSILTYVKWSKNNSSLTPITMWCVFMFLHKGIHD